MRKLIAILGLFVIIGMGMAEDFVKGEARGAEAPGAAIIGNGQDSDLAGLMGYLNGKGSGALNLSGADADIFDTPFFQMGGWAFDTSSYSLTPSQSAFMKDNAKDGKPLGKAKKAAYVGAPSIGEDPREI